MKTTFFAAALLGGALIMSSCGGKQTEEKTIAEGEKSPEVEAIRVAGELAHYGQTNQSATALIEAANILASTPRVELDAQLEASTQTENEGEKAEKRAFDATALLEEAKDLADDDEHLLALIANVENKIAAQAEGTRGATGGAKYTCATVYAGQTDTYRQSFYGGSFAEIAVIGDGDTDLDLFVYDENGNLIVRDDTYSGDCYVSFNPRWTGLFIIKVVNRGRVYNNYCLATN